ncbi:MAG: hypothetical protein CSB44_02720 [Gammaproteobacteria bacterium]|nr:MAG: hypothetical protein CSB44_02720 [Gammaproteobacteria bacterium]
MTGNLADDARYEYDSSAMSIDVTDPREPGSLFQRYHYSKNGAFLSRDTYNENREVAIRLTFHYAENGNLERVDEQVDGKLTTSEVFETDANGTLLSKAGYTPDGTLIGEMTYVYDDSRRLSRVELQSAVEDYQETVTYGYDDADATNYSSKQYDYDNDDTVDLVEYFRHDDAGNIVRMEVHDATGNLVEVNEMTYERSETAVTNILLFSELHYPI